jgi:hypothetical protein
MKWRLKKMNMKNKNVVPTILMTLLMIACCSEPTYEITIIDIESRALISDGINVIEFDKQNSIDKDEFVIEIDIIEQEEIASSEFLNHKDGDTKVSRAAVVPCADQVLIYKNNIESIKVEVLDVGTGYSFKVLLLEESFRVLKRMFIPLLPYYGNRIKIVHSHLNST